MPSIPPGSPPDETPYARVTRPAIPSVFEGIPGPTERLTELDFRSLMTPLLRQCCGLAGIVHAASHTEEYVIEDLRHALEILNDYLQVALTLAIRYQAEQDALARDRLARGPQP